MVFDTRSSLFTDLILDASAQSLALNTALDVAGATPLQVPVERSVHGTD